ncbi:MAG TPA: ribbon-helix-helix protein, CopG family [Acidilobales archaeon]|nr:MAG: hypothetical protein B6U85_05845 [Desulfurococcales archaeon ex4484_42]HDN75974.1 ribbon-helix-helix protein, CopG family [Acidilobales archaeon]
MARTKGIYFRINKDLLERIDRIAQIKGTSRSEVMREALRKYADEFEKSLKTT